MSLILDALRKLEREKDARDPGVLVVGSVPWGDRQGSRRPLVLLLGAAGLLALVAAGWWLLRPSSPRPAPEALPPAPPPSLAAPPTLAPPARPAATSETAPAAAPDVATPLAPPARRATLPGEAAGGETPAGEAFEAPPADTTEATPPAAPDDALRLHAISVRDGHPVALIGDRLVREGDRFDGVTVMRIGEAEVEVEVRGTRRVLRFP